LHVLHQKFFTFFSDALYWATLDKDHQHQQAQLLSLSLSFWMHKSGLPDFFVAYGQNGCF